MTRTMSGAFTRRTLLAAAGAGVAAAALPPEPSFAGPGAPIPTEIPTMTSASFLAYVGCRTTKDRGARGEGLRVFRVAAERGPWEPVQLVGDLANPSFLALNARGDRLYTVHGDGSTATAFAVEPRTGTLTRIGTQETGGSNPVHLSVDPSGRWLVVANYTSGNVAVLPVEASGALGPLRSRHDLPGEPGPHRIEQKSSHPHEAAFDPSGRFVIAPDKGLDRIFVLAFDAGSGSLSIHAQVKAREGAGPRHIVFAPRKPFAYVVDELDSSVATYAWDGARGELRPLEVIPSTPPRFTGDNRAAEIAIAPDGRFVFVSNRGHDSIGIFAVDAIAGTLAPVAWQGTQGRQPRFMALDPASRILYAANEATDTIVPFAVNPADGRLTPTGSTIETGSPVCIVFRAGTAG